MSYRCSKCATVKPASDFYPSQQGNGRWCIECFRGWHRARAGAAPEPRACEVCETWIDAPARNVQRYCSERCKQAALYARRNPPLQRECEACGKDITDMRRNAVVCSPACLERRRRAAGRGADAKRRLLLSKYGLTPEMFDALLLRQGGGCGICGTTDPPGNGWVVDHDHACCAGSGNRTCGTCVRGILCTRCNTGLGMFDDDMSKLLAAVAYLAAGTAHVRERFTP